jgi:hypothetical protein
MIDKFEKFIETSGKSKSEIKKAIEKLLKQKVEQAVSDFLTDAENVIRQNSESRKSAEKTDSAASNQDNAASEKRQGGEKKYASEKIPPRRADNAHESHKGACENASDLGRASRNTGAGTAHDNMHESHKGACENAADLGFASRNTSAGTAHDNMHESHKGACENAADLGRAPRNTSAGTAPAPDLEYRLTPKQRMLYFDAPEQIVEISPEQLKNVPDNTPIAEKIQEMRKLESSYSGGRLVNPEKVLVKQGLFMEDVEDDFGSTTFCAVQYPVYGTLSQSQLRTYFSWRTDVRRGVYRDTDKPYIVLYCYELLNKIGAKSAYDAFKKLLKLWEQCRGFAGWLDILMPRWLKDFYAYNDLGDRGNINELFPVNLSDWDEDTQRIILGDYSQSLDYLAANSAYDINKSIFLTDETRKLMNGALEQVLKALSDFFGEKKIELSELICGSLKKDFNWAPFKGAYVLSERMDGFRERIISPQEKYCIKRGAPTLEMFTKMPYRGFIGYVLKCAEAELRKRVGFKRRLNPNIDMVMSDFRNRTKLTEAVSGEEFEDVIIRAVNEFCDSNGIAPAAKKPKQSRKVDYGDEPEIPAKPVKVEIDMSKLEEIRRKSDELTKLLIIDENFDDEDSEGGEIPTAEEMNDAAERIADDDFSERINSFYAASDEDESFSANVDFTQLPIDWQAFAKSLGETHVRVLRAMSRGEDANELCRSLGLFPQMVYEEINTLALNNFGDTVIDDNGIISDYKEDVDNILDLFGKG